MKRFILIRHFPIVLVLAWLVQPVKAQSLASDSSKRFFDFTIGLGVAVHSAPSIVNYINAIASPSPDQKVGQFNTAAEFYAIPELQVADQWSVGIEYQPPNQVLFVAGSVGVLSHRYIVPGTNAFAPCPPTCFW